LQRKRRTRHPHLVGRRIALDTVLAKRVGLCTTRPRKKKEERQDSTQAYQAVGADKRNTAVEQIRFAENKGGACTRLNSGSLANGVQRFISESLSTTKRAAHNGFAAKRNITCTVALCISPSARLECKWTRKKTPSAHSLAFLKIAQRESAQN